MLSEEESKQAEAAGYTPEIWAEMTERERGLALKRPKPEPPPPVPDPVAPAGQPAGVRLDFSAIRQNVSSQAGVPIGRASGGPLPPQTERRFDDEPVPGAFEPRRVIIPDLVGDRAPRTLTDIYARFPVGRPGGEGYFIRVDRTQPKVYQGIPTSGYVGKIQENLTEEAFGMRFGGREYQLTVYGPDPRGQTDDFGQPVVKALTDSVKHIVPIVPPNINYFPMPDVGLGANQMNMNPFMGHPMGMSGFHAPTTQADASIHKTNTDFVAGLVRDMMEQQRQGKSNGGGESVVIMDFVKEQVRAQTERAREEAKARDDAWQRQMEQEREARRAAQEELRMLKEGAQEATGKSTQSTLELVKALGPNREQEAQRLNEYHRQQMDNLRQSNEESLKLLKSQHEAETRRGEERYREQETYYSRRMADQKEGLEEQIKTLRSEVERVRREAREDADRRIQDMKDQHAAEIRNMEKAHEREMRSLKESYDVRIDTRDKTYDMERTNLAQRAEDARREAEEARRRAEELSDPIAVLEKSKAQAEALGYMKDDANEPKTAFERFAATAGAGLGQALATINDWGPQMLQGVNQQRLAAAAAQQQAVQQLPPAQLQAARQQAAAVAQQTAAQRPRRRAATVRWGAEDVEITTPVVESGNLGFEGNAPSPEPPRQEAPVPQTTPTPAQAVDAPTAPTEDAVQQLLDIELPPKFRNFEKETVFAFLSTCDQHINISTDPSVFAEHFQKQYPAESAQLTQAGLMVEDIQDFVSQLPDTEASAILRRDGTKWLTSMLNKLRSLTQAT
jgi:hypothetical protein